MTSDQAWEAFEKSGSIFAYLEYKKISSLEQPSFQEDTCHEIQNGRDNSSGAAVS